MFTQDAQVTSLNCALHITMVKLEEATLSHTPQTDVNKGNFGQLLQQGLHFLNSGQVQEANNCVNTALSIHPESTQANFLSGLTEYYLGHHQKALLGFQRVLKHDPNNCAAWAHSAELYMLIGLPLKAMPALEKAISHQDGSANIQQMIAMVKSLLNEHEEALLWFEKATQQQPRNPNFALNHATCLMYLGQLDKAEEKLTSILKVQPAFANAHWLLSGLKKANDRQHMDEMQQLLANIPFGPIDIAYMQYARGKEAEDLSLWSVAFDAFSKASEAKRKTIQFDESAEIEMYETLEQCFSLEWMKNHPSGYDDASPIFVLGEPRSGTTLVERIICAHSYVHSAGELRNFINCISQMPNSTGTAALSPQLVHNAVNVDTYQLGESYMKSVAQFRGNTPHFVDKMPSNFLFLPLILKALPKAKIIHLRRDPMDTCFSGFKQLFTQAYPYSYDQREIARHHARYLKLMATYRERFGDQYLEMDYEALAKDIAPKSRELIAFLGLPWEEQCLDFHKQSSAVTTASSVQVRQAVHTKSIGRWLKYEAQLQPMKKELEKQLRSN